MQLKRRQLQRQPVRLVARPGNLTQRPPDITRCLGSQSRVGEDVGDQRRRGGLAVGSGDADAAGIAQGDKADVHLGVNIKAGAACGFERGHIRRYAGRHDHRHRTRDAIEVVPAEVDRGLCLAQRAGPAVEDRSGSGVGRVHRKAQRAKE
jgi:hypothetical protein